MDIMTSLFDQEEVLRRHIISTNREREQKTREEGRRNSALDIARTALQMGQVSIEYVAKITGLTIDEMERIAEDVRNNG